jgi:hypothetical protein
VSPKQYETTDIHLRNTEGPRLGTVSSIIMTAGEFKPVNGAANLR